MEHEIGECLSEQPEPIRQDAESPRQVILDVVPEAAEKQHGGGNVIAYSWHGSMGISICAVAPHSGHVRLHRVAEDRTDGHSDLIREPAEKTEP